MDDVRALADKTAPEGTVIQALEQTGGRGRFGNVWASPAGNVYMTALLRPNASPNQAAQLAFVVALALFEAIGTFDKRTVQLKWPNDVLIEGTKAAGILLEQSLTPTGQVAYVLVGMGINVLAPPEGRACVQAPSVNAMRDAVLGALEQRYTQWQQQGFAAVRENWLQHAYGLGKPITARMSQNTTTGVFEGIDETGALLLRTNGGIERITGAEIQF